MGFGQYLPLAGTAIGAGLGAYFAPELGLSMLAAGGAGGGLGGGLGMGANMAMTPPPVPTGTPPPISAPKMSPASSPAHQALKDVIEAARDRNKRGIDWPDPSQYS